MKLGLQKHEKVSLEWGGQFTPEKGGHFDPEWGDQFGPEKGGHFSPESGGHFDRFFQGYKTMEEFELINNNQRIAA